ncbi:hypothetical protein [Alteromonas stellipolaris]|uniref:hypothetical protein n=1 Tax=Alteromonas stellipolaris TaxID=233316 RepID=UPI002494AD1D|nr:hypothetical protein [Alteromonas stellipolaris]
MNNKLRNYNLLNAPYYVLTMGSTHNESERELIVHALISNGLWEKAATIADENCILSLIRSSGFFNELTNEQLHALLDVEQFEEMQIDDYLHNASASTANRLLVIFSRVKKLRRLIPKLESKLRIPFLVTLSLKRDSYLSVIYKNSFSNAFIRTCELNSLLSKTKNKSSTRKKVAVCISGQMRNYKFACNKLIEALSEYDVQFFISTWKNIGRKNTGALNFPQLSRMSSPQIARLLLQNTSEEEDMRLKFPNFFGEIEKQIQDEDFINAEDLNQSYPSAIVDLEDESDYKEEAFGIEISGNTKKMLYKMDKCNRMKRSYEESNDMLFDAVVRIRPDLVVSEKIDVESIIASNSIATGFCVSRFLDDQIYIGSSQNIDYVTSTYQYLRESGKKPFNDPLAEIKSPHNLMWSVCNEKRLKYSLLPVNCWLTRDRYDVKLLEAAFEKDMKSVG